MVLVGARARLQWQTSKYPGASAASREALGPHPGVRFSPTATKCSTFSDAYGTTLLPGRTIRSSSGTPCRLPAHSGQAEAQLDTSASGGKSDSLSSISFAERRRGRRSVPACRIWALNATAPLIHRYALLARVGYLSILSLMVRRAPTPPCSSRLIAASLVSATQGPATT